MRQVSKKDQAIRSLYADTLKTTNGDHKAARRPWPSKKGLPGIMWSAHFQRAWWTRIWPYSGMIGADLANLTQRSNKYTFQQD